MNTLLLLLFIVGSACFLLTGILVVLKKPNMTLNCKFVREDINKETGEIKN